MFSQFKNELTFDATETMYPSRMRCYGDGQYQFDDPTRQYYGFVFSGEAEVIREFSNVCVGSAKKPSKMRSTLGAFMYFALNGPLQLNVKGEVIVIERFGYRGLNEIGGPVEAEGRLAYIDNCRSTILVHPARKGDPVLNYLQFPPDVLQTMHFHPTVRMGIIFEGEGVCHLKDKDVPLKPGMVFYLPENTLHCFESKGEGLRIIAYHPDSDTGPTDENHPMLNRTYLFDRFSRG